MSSEIETELESQPERLASKVTPNTYISLALVVILISGAIWLNNRFNSLDNKFESLVKDVSTMTASEWTLQDQEIFALKLERSNKGMVVPEVREVVGLKRDEESTRKNKN